MFIIENPEGLQPLPFGGRAAENGSGGRGLIILISKSLSTDIKHGRSVNVDRFLI